MSIATPDYTIYYIPQKLWASHEEPGGILVSIKVCQKYEAEYLHASCVNLLATQPVKYYNHMLFSYKC